MDCDNDVNGYIVPMEGAEPLRLRRFMLVEPIDEKRCKFTMVNRVDALGGILDFLLRSDTVLGFIITAMKGGFDEDIRAAEKLYAAHGAEKGYWERDGFRSDVACKLLRSTLLWSPDEI